MVVDGRGLQTQLTIHSLCIVGERDHGGQTAVKEKLKMREEGARDGRVSS